MSDLNTKLTDMQYKVTQQCGTEPPFQNKYWNNKKDGIYVDVVSGNALFSSLDKYDSGSGWPSFTKPIKKNVVSYEEDKSLGIERIEVRTKYSHLGHVFDDGPGPDGKRYCINSAALKFVAYEDLDKEGYSEYKKLFKKKKTELATFAAGCFWGVEHILKKINGVISTTVGYIGGDYRNPTYQDVSTGETGYAEAVQVEFDTKLVSYKTLLSYFWRLHNPTTLNSQGPDFGTQYRSAIFYHSEKQKKDAIESKESFDSSGVFDKKSVTEIVPASTFYPAENYHQDYFSKNGGHVCHVLRDK